MIVYGSSVLGGLLHFFVCASVHMCIRECFICLYMEAPGVFACLITSCESKEGSHARLTCTSELN